MAESDPILELEHISCTYGQFLALNDVSLTLNAGDVFAVIGANGAGKSTLMRTIAGLHSPKSGSIRLFGQDITHLGAPKRVGSGIALVPEGRRLFGSLTVEENLQSGTYLRRQGSWNIERIYEMFPWMRERRDQRASQLSGGEQQAVAISRALLTNPKLLLIDELSLGLAPVVVKNIYASLDQLRSDGLTIMIVEQDVSQALGVATGVHCLLEGKTTLEGLPGDFSQTEIEAAYFGFGTQSAKESVR